MNFTLEFDGEVAWIWNRLQNQARLMERMYIYISMYGYVCTCEIEYLQQEQILKRFGYQYSYSFRTSSCSLFLLLLLLRFRPRLCSFRSLCGKSLGVARGFCFISFIYFLHDKI